MNAGALFLAVFLASGVEAVEATTIVLVAGTARGWRSAAYGAVTALVVLCGVVAALGPAILAIPADALRLVVGTLLLVFGLQWLRKAVLRAAGILSRHDEDRIYQRTLEAAAGITPHRVGRVPDWYGFTLAFQGVLLEGMEVVFIVLTFGSSQRAIPLASLAAGAAAVVVAAAGFAVRAPLARVPENALKFVVGIMLTGFGTLWAGEGAGAHWPGADAALLVILPVMAVLSLTLAARLRASSHRTAAGTAAAREAG